MDVFCGIDWAEGHHDVAIIDTSGKQLAKCRINDDLDGYEVLLDLLAEHGDTAEAPIPIAIETSRGLLVATLRTGTRQIFAVNPMAASRYRDRHGVSRKKSDPGDALVLANIIRTDMHMHRPLPTDSDLAQAIAVLARAHQDAVWNRQQIASQLRSVLREYFPAALDAWREKAGTLTRPDARKILGAAPTPTLAALLPAWKLRLMMTNAGRKRGITEDAERLHTLFRQPAARQLPAVEEAMGIQAKALLTQLNAACKAVDELAKAVERTFRTHPDAPIMLSFPGVGAQVGARILAEVGDDRARFATAGGLKAYAGAAPITRASGKRKYVGRRFVKNNRLNHAGYLWAFATLTHSKGANAHYRRRREAGDWHAQALRHLFNRMLGQLHHCLQQRVFYDESVAFPLTSGSAVA
ncbi:IS110 family transposase [Streptomyces microflavus]|uniref:IS110 family transposase n=1 Tax=Streptomyces microflavus TaxID=1919 RepID=UPI002E308E64|nr:IS110 family transposase [Streptomyces microflavus]WSS31970.1 IS110 family transposase [Streptomyces microflavus]WST19483.1 IS110 family transposase [Streptomyces microflavus]